MVQLGELMKDLAVPPKEPVPEKKEISEADQEIEDFIREMENVKVQRD